MNLQRYEYTVSDTFFTYEFDSLGPNGKIRKVIAFKLYEADELSYFSLVFGNYIEAAGGIDVVAVSDNKDTEKVLATVFAVLLDFTTRFPDKWVYAIGSTPARTRLYQISIAKYWHVIEPVLLVYGIRSGSIEPFEKNSNYEAFLFKKKIVIL